jgi:hypothetical protein
VMWCTAEAAAGSRWGPDEVRPDEDDGCDLHQGGVWADAGGLEADDPEAGELVGVDGDGCLGAHWFSTGLRLNACCARSQLRASLSGRRKSDVLAGTEDHLKGERHEGGHVIIGGRCPRPSASCRG